MKIKVEHELTMIIIWNILPTAKLIFKTGMLLVKGH